MTNDLIYFVNIPYPKGRANTRRILTIAKGIASQGYNVKLIIPLSRFQQNRIVDHDGVSIEFCLIPSKNKNILTPKGRVKFRIQILSRIKWYFKAFEILFVRANQNTYFYQPNIDSIPILFLSKILGHKVICEYVDAPWTNKNEFLIDKLHYWGQVFTDKLSAKLSDKIFVISRYLYGYYNKYSIVEPVIIPIVVDSKKYFPKRIFSEIKHRNTINITYTGSYVKTEGLESLIYSFSNLIKKYGNLVVNVAGASLLIDSDDPNELFKKYSIDNYAKNHGYLEEQGVINLLQLSDILVMPKHDCYVNNAGLGTKLSEYLASGKPVVSSAIGDVPLYLKNEVSAILYDPKAVNALEDSLKTLIDSKKLRDKIGRRGQIVALKYFDKDVITQKIIKHIKEN